MSEIKFSVLENRAILKVIGEDARGFLVVGAKGCLIRILLENKP